MANSQTFTLNIKALFDASDVKAKVGDIQNTLQKLKLPDKLSADLNKSFANVNKALDDFTSKTEKGIKTKSDATGITKSFDTVTKELTNLDNLLIKVKSQIGDGIDLSQIIKLPDNAKNQITQLQNEINALQKQINDINVGKLKSLENALTNVKTKGSLEHGKKAIELFELGDIDGAIKEIDAFITKLSTFQQTANVSNSVKALTNMRNILLEAQSETSNLYAEIGNKTQQQANITANCVNDVTNALNNQTNAFHQSSTAASGLSGKINELTTNQAQFVREIDQVKSRIQYFFGLSNAINLVKRAIRGAVDTIKELDKAMTETAVVTDFSVGDMWEQLPEYTKRANELGVSTLAAYQAATLYYQQGLKTEEVNALSVETLKMARIAGLDAAEATDRMTNALRGFNMALTEQNAQRVDDVYSELAANTASNVDEISTAMTKVASLAHNANMEFETTAAFLSQIIETTRESAETAGTALKTVVARFSEVKKLIDTDQLRGQDEEGQVIDVNRVGQALRTAGIDLNKYFLGEVGLDDIFMELAEKWDSLTSVQQRYIATQAAGSRQQSRFIALMSDYARTQELVGKAYNAEGASARQFAKTQESLESKLARLKNAWNEFLMGLTNSGLVKGFVDVLTNLLNAINKITSAFGEGGNAIAKWGVALGAIFGGKALLQSGGLLDNAIGALTGNTILGSILGKAGVGGVFTKAITPEEQLKNKNNRRRGLFGSIGDFFTRFSNYRKYSSADREAASQSSLSAIESAIEYYTQNPDEAGPGGLEEWQRMRDIKQGKDLEAFLPNLSSLGKKFGGTGIGKKIIEKMGFAGMAGGAEGAAAGMAALGTAIAGVTAAAAVAAVTIKALYDASPEGQLKIAEKWAASINEVAVAAKKTTDELNKVSDSYKNYTEAIDKSSNLKDYNEAINNRNEYIQSLLASNEDLVKFTQVSQENGQLVFSIDTEKLDQSIKDYEAAVNQTSIASAFAQANVANKQAQLYDRQRQRIGAKTDFRNENDYYTPKDLSNKDKAQSQRLEYQAAQSRSQAENAAQQAYLRALSSQKLDDSLANTIAGAMAKGFNADQWNTRVTKQKGQNAIQGVDLDATYQALTGQAFEAGLDKNAKAQALAIAQISKEYSDKTQDIADLLKGSDSGLYKNILSAMDGSKLANIDLLNDVSSIGKQLGIDQAGSQLEKLASTLGVPVNKLTAQIEENIKIARKQQQDRIKANTEKLLTGGTSWDTVQQFASLNFDKQQIAQSLFESIDTSWLSDSVSESIIQGIQVGGQDFADAFKNIDLSNPIEGYDKLTKLTSNTNPRIKETAQLLLDAGKSTDQFSAANQLAYFYTSENYDAVAESLEKLKGENENISSSNIIEAAKSSSELATMLDNGTMSAKALATALSALSTGDIDISNLSNSILAALNAMDDLDGAVKRTIDDLNNFDPGYDENDVTSFIGKALENANENIGKGAYGNNVMGNYMKKIFGDFEYEGPKEGYGDAYKSWLDNNVKWLEANKDNMYSAWQDFSSTLDNQMLGAAEIYEKDGEIIVNANGMTTQQLVDAMVATGQVTKTQAEMMIADFKNYSADFAAEMAANDLPNAMQAWYDALPEINGNKIYDETELETLKTLLGASDKAIADAIDGLNKSAGELRGIKWTDENGERTADSIKNALKDAGINDISSKRDIPRSNEQLEIFNYDKMKEAYQNLGIPQMFEADFNKVASESGKFFADIFGKGTREIAINEGETAGEAYARAYQQAVNQDLADRLGEVFKEAFQEIEITINTTDSNAKIQETADGLKSLNDTVAAPTVNLNDNATGQITSVSNQLSTLDGKTATVHINIQKNGSIPSGPVASGGIVKSFSEGSGTRYVQPGFALTGEEGPEIVWNKEQGYAYITGKNGAEFQNLQPGDRVFNAAETQRIFRNSSLASGGMVPSYAKGYENATKPKDQGKGGGSGGGSGDDKDDEWKNDLDWLYNVMENIAELERQQNIYQEEYEDLLKDQTKTGQDLYKMLIKQLGNLYTQLDHQTYTLERREQEMREFMDTTNDQDDYLWYNWEDRTIEIDWDAIDKITDQEQYDHIADLISEAEEIQDKMDDAEDAIIDVENQIQELENIWRDTFTEFEERVLDAIVKMYQSVIDNYSELNDTLNETNTNILDAINKEISLQRQIRDNTKTEQEIADNEAQLAYMQRDTTGGNKLEALQMGKDLDDQRQDYQDNLIDQAIQKLQDDNDMAAQQREKQIEIMQAQLDYQSENGEFNAYIRELMESAVDPDGHLATDSDLYKLLAEQENIDAMTKVQRDVWEEELNGTFKEVVAFLIKEQNEAEGTYFTAVTAAFNGISETFDKAFHGSYSQGGAGSGSSSGGSGGGGGGKSPSSTKNQGNCPKGGNHTPVRKGDRMVCSKCGKDLGSAVATGVNKKQDSATNADLMKQEQIQMKKNSQSTATQTRKYGDQSTPAKTNKSTAQKAYLNWEKIKKQIKGRESGGIVQQTGVAMLHGSVKEPEYVLNARQTDAFLKLADVLPAAMNTSGQNVSNTFGATTNNVVINVDKIDSDYSVDQMVDRVKEKLFESGSYRNNNVLSLMR